MYPSLNRPPVCGNSPIVPLGCCAILVLFFICLVTLPFAVHEGERTLPNESVAISCVGLDDEAERLPDVRYEVSTRNVIVGAVLVETLVFPVYVAVTSVYCPVERIK